ncbi:hypothetical protein FE257_004442 [Aspergillus nanangensis]|uniref:Uncharacterized protein n=1 Tax=Aspergillus nanangensis TaxID=2582783 RepID=A0AAD4GZC6_ASPNN|nr:hypothetical protein FE257_004442 [Aspergillus nanangensis]
MSTQYHNCAFDGDEDLYGIGVRVGIYCQWMATLLARTMVIPEETSSAEDTNLCFQVALLSTLLFAITGRKQPVIAPEVLVTLPLCFGGFAIASALSMGFREVGAPSRSLIRLLFSVNLFGLLVGVNMWFWWRGIYLLHDPACTYYTFMFSKVTIDHLLDFYRAIPRDPNFLAIF